MERRQFYKQIFRPLGCLKLWQARHSMVLDFIEEKDIRTMIDLGTSESTLLMKVQRGLTVAHLIGIDIDDEVLIKAEQNLIPEGIQNDLQYSREYDQLVQLYKGSALTKYAHLKQINQIDLITLVEVIEHIQQKDLQQLNENVFGFLRPTYVWMSTPNSEFNTLFKWDQGKKFRHYDHKFEWTRKKFQDYVDGICEKYNYKATITGVGLAVSDADLGKGFCSQIAIFEIQSSHLEEEKVDPPTMIEEPYQYQANQHHFQVKHSLEVKHNEQGCQPLLELVHEHTNASWLSRVQHLLSSAIYQTMSLGDSRGYLPWSQAVSSIKRKPIIKRLIARDNIWSCQFHLKNVIFEYLKKIKRNENYQFVCQSQGIRIVYLKEGDEESSGSNQLTQWDNEFEREMQEWKQVDHWRQVDKQQQGSSSMLQSGHSSSMVLESGKIYTYDKSEPLFRQRTARNSNKIKKSLKSSSKSSKSSSSSNSSDKQSSSFNSSSSSQLENSLSQSFSSQGSHRSEDSWGEVETIKKPVNQKRLDRRRKRVFAKNSEKEKTKEEDKEKDKEKEKEKKEE